MALPNQLQQALDEHLRDLQRVRDMTARVRADMAAGNAELPLLTSILTRAALLRADIVELKGRAGVVQFVRNNYGRPAMDIGVRYNAVQAALEAVMTTIRGGLPTGAQGFVLAFQLSADPVALPQLVWRTLTPAQTATLQSDLDAVVAAIDALFADLAGLI